MFLPSLGRLPWQSGSLCLCFAVISMPQLSLMSKVLLGASHLPFNNPFLWYLFSEGARASFAIEHWF